MSGTVDEIFASGHELAQSYAEAVRALNDHWPDADGICIGCGDNYPCAEEWITQRAIAGIETRWRRLAGEVWKQVSAAALTAGNEQIGEQMSISDATFRRASGHVEGGGSAVEVAFLDDAVVTRDSKDPQGTVQAYTRHEWATFIAGVKAGEFDR